MAKIIHTSDKIILTEENKSHLQALAAKRGWKTVEDFHIYTPLDQPSLSPADVAWAEAEAKRILAERHRAS